mmetsp:Transcript_30057/g.41942  ORF Transcript_30057/g.41942 Transcript_30057/m.41942 type:complete len:117 (+) Transcript_30057:21-371(+)
MRYSIVSCLFLLLALVAGQTAGECETFKGNQCSSAFTQCKQVELKTCGCYLKYGKCLEDAKCFTDPQLRRDFYASCTSPDMACSDDEKEKCNSASGLVVSVLSVAAGLAVAFMAQL